MGTIRHNAEGDPCAKCGAPAEQHWSPPPRKKRSHADDDEKTIIGVDGEGYDTPDGRHVYTYLAAVDEHGKVLAEAENWEGLSHDECVTMLLSLPKESLKFGFMFSYDVTKIIEQMPNTDRFYLMRPGARNSHVCKECSKKWKGPSKRCPHCEAIDAFEDRTEPVRYQGRAYDFFNGSLTVRANYVRGDKSVPGKWLDQVKIWDCFRFFGCAFVEALSDWQIGTPEQIERIAGMKGKRGAFEVESHDDIKNYCKEECHLLAKMMRKVIDSHKAAGIPLKRYEGAGSTASALLHKNGVGMHKGPHVKTMRSGLQNAIMSAFFGGRFENSVIGKVTGTIYGNDISSAYPYALSFLPCLECGEWKHVKGDAKKIWKAVDGADLGVCKFKVGKLDKRAREKLAWGPLPCRDDKGNICYGTNFRGWAWKPEIEVALRGWPDLVELDGEAWIYKTKCDHEPWKFLPSVYAQRVAWGKEGKGKALKLGVNACYGKTAQNVGDAPPFQSFVWAGMTTSSTRGQILDAILRARDPWNVLSIATDGIYSSEKLELPAPENTGTAEILIEEGDDKGKVAKKPLGGWEEKIIPEGVFLAKPGLYFRLKTTLKEIRARGVGRKELFKMREELMSAFAQWDRKDLDYCVKLESRRFYAAKNSLFAISGCSKCNTTWPGVPERGCQKCGEIGDEFEVKDLTTKLCPECEKKQLKGTEKKKALADGARYGYEVNVDEVSYCGACCKPVYGTWGVRDTDVKFDPMPKRERKMREGGSFARLHVRDLGGITSSVYLKGQTSPEGQKLRENKEMLLDQPDWDALVREEMAALGVEDEGLPN